MRPDISEIGGGGGYGVVQWTSPNAWESGANYVQRLLRERALMVIIKWRQHKLN